MSVYMCRYLLSVFVKMYPVFFCLMNGFYAAKETTVNRSNDSVKRNFRKVRTMLKRLLIMCDNMTSLMEYFL